MNAPTETRPQRAGDEGQLRTATDDIQTGDVAAELRLPGLVAHQQRLHGAHRGLDEGSARVVKVCHRDRHGHGIDGYRDELCRWGQVFLGRAAVFQEALPRRVTEATGVRACGRSEKRGKYRVEVVAPDHIQAARPHDLVKRSRGRDDGRIEGSAAKIVDQDRRALGVQRPGVTMRVLKTCCRWLIHHRQHIPTGAAEGLQRQKTLGGPRVRRDADERLKGLRFRHGRDGGVRAELIRGIREEARERIDDRNRVVPQA